MPARSQAQQRFMGMVHAEKEGTLDKSKLDPEFAAKIERVAASIKAKQARDFAETKHKGLPKKVKKKGMKKKATTLDPSKLDKITYKGKKPVDELLRHARAVDSYQDDYDDHDDRQQRVQTGVGPNHYERGDEGWGAGHDKYKSDAQDGVDYHRKQLRAAEKKHGFTLGQRRDVINEDLRKYRKFKKQGMKKKANYYLKMLQMAAKAAKGTSKVTKAAPQVTKQVVKATPKVTNKPAKFNVTSLGSGHYDAFLGKNKIGQMSVNPHTRMVDDVKILKDYRKKGFGTKFYGDVLKHEGILVRNPETVSPGALGVWKNISRKYPAFKGGQGVRWPGELFKGGEFIKNARKKWHTYKAEGKVPPSQMYVDPKDKSIPKDKPDNWVPENFGINTDRQEALEKIHIDKLKGPLQTSYVKNPNDLNWKQDIDVNPDFSQRPQEAFRMQYGKDGKPLDMETFKRDILEPARAMKKKYPTHGEYLHGPMMKHYKKEFKSTGKSKGYSSMQGSKLNNILSLKNEPKQNLDDTTLNKLVGVKVIPNPRKGKTTISPSGKFLGDARGAAQRGGTAIAASIEQVDPTNIKKRTTIPHEMTHTTQSPNQPASGKHNHGPWSSDPNEMQAGAAHIKREYYRSTGKVAKDPASSQEALKWYKQQDKKEVGGVQRHSGMGTWLNDEESSRALEGMMPFVVDNKTPKKGKGKFLNQDTPKLASARKMKDTTAVGIAGTTSILVPLVPMHSLSAAKRAPKGETTKAIAGSSAGGYIGNVPGAAYAYHKIRKAGKATPTRGKKRTSKFKWKNIKKNLSKKDFAKFMLLSALGQGVGAAGGYAASTSNYKKKKK